MSQRNRRYRDKKPLSTGSLAMAGVALGSFFLLIAVLLLMSFTKERGQTIYGGLSVLAMIVAVLTLIRGSRLKKNDNFEKVSRQIGVIVPGLTVLAWVLIYCVGIFMG